MMDNAAAPPLPPELFAAVADLILQAGQAIMAVYGRDFEVEFKSDQSPLTEADLAAHRIICQGLAALSGWPILSEESGEIGCEERQQWPRFWLVDPLDGTKEFVKRNGEFTVNIALVDAGEAVAGFVYAPALGLLYVGARGVGAYLLEREPGSGFGPLADYGGMPADAMRLPRPVPGAASRTLRVVASRSHRNAATDQIIGQFARKYDAVEIVGSGSSLKLCLVAEGRADLYPRLAPTMEWDTAAAQAVVEAAGATCTRYPEGDPLRYNKKSLLNPHFLVARRG